MNDPACDLNTARSGIPTTGVASVARLFAVFDSPPVLTRAMLVAVPMAPACAVACTVRVLEPPGGIGPALLHVMTNPVAITPLVAQLQPPPMVPVNATFAGSESMSVTGPVVAAPPPLVTVSVHWAPTPTLKVAGVCDLATDRSGRSTLAGVVVPVSFDAFKSPAVSELALFTTDAATVESTVAVSATCTLSPAASAGAAGRVQLTFCPVGVQLKPPPTPDWKVRPVGSASLTVITPVVAPGETFTTVSTKLAVPPTAIVPESDFRIARSGTLTTPTGPDEPTLFAALPSLGVPTQA